MLAELSYSVFHNAALQTPVNDDIPANWID
jgi:hypothetical protein